MQHDFRDSAGEEDLHGREIPWAVGQGIDQPWYLAVDVGPVGAVGRWRPAAWAIAGMCSRRLVEPPKAAWSDHGVANGCVCQDIARTQAELRQAQDRPC